MSEPLSSRKRPLDHASEEEEKEIPNKKLKTQSKKKRPGFDEEIFSETSYFIDNGKHFFYKYVTYCCKVFWNKGLRYVKPYYFTFTTYAKGRWVGRTVYDVFCREFQSETPEFYERALQAGKITVDSVTATMETVITNNALVCHQVHRHEPPVTDEPLRVMHEDEHLVVINKPASIPVHPCGRYRHNTVVFLLGKEHNLRNLHTIHRLDRLTSGLLIFAKSLHKAQILEQQIRDHLVTKEYVCRVQGEFPKDPVECAEPIMVVSHKLGVCRVAATGKPCSTHFTRLSYNGSSSVVKCIPKTGRMHQIRVHLQWLGHPILGDPLYNHHAWGKERGKLGKGITDMAEVISEIVRTNYSSEKSASKPTEILRTAIDENLQSEGGQSVKGEEEEEGEGGKGSCEPGNRESEDINSIVTDTSEPPHVTSRVASSGDGQLNETDGSEPDKVSLTDSASIKETVPPLLVVDGEVSLEKKNLHSSSSPPPGAADLSVAGEVMGHGREAVAQHGEVDPDCTECRRVRADPTPRELFMFLHALSYKGPDWEFTTDLPPWAAPNWKEDIKKSGHTNTK